MHHLDADLGHARPCLHTLMAPRALLDDNVEEIFLRMPPDDPACLLRGALVCKHWARLLAGRAFLHRYYERHVGRLPLLGFLANEMSTGGIARFVPTFAFSPALRHRGYRAHDARHGHVLLNLGQRLLFIQQMEEAIDSNDGRRTRRDRATQ